MKTAKFEFDAMIKIVIERESACQGIQVYIMILMTAVKF